MKTILFLVVIVLVLFVTLVYFNTFIWAWVVPDVFAGLVAAGLLPSSITFMQSLKLTALFSAFFGLSRFNGRSKND
jgi:hypothetical protein